MIYFCPRKRDILGSVPNIIRSPSSEIPFSHLVESFVSLDEGDAQHLYFIWEFPLISRYIITVPRGLTVISHEGLTAFTVVDTVLNHSFPPFKKCYVCLTFTLPQTRVENPVHSQFNPFFSKLFCPAFDIVFHKQNKVLGLIIPDFLQSRNKL